MERIMSERVTTLERVEVLVAEVKGLRLSNRRLKQIMFAGAVALASAGVAVGYAVNAAHDAHDAVDASRAAIVEACRSRNAGFQATRAKFDAMFDIFEALTTDDQGREVMATLRAIPDPVDTDCTKDGRIDSADYPQE